MTSVRVTIDAGVGRMVLSHPPSNILTRQVLRVFRAELRRLAEEPELRVVILSAAGRHFSGGADVSEHLPPQFELLIAEFVETIAELDEFPLPVIAAVHGRCLGGGFELVLGADIVLAADTAMFGQPEILLGVAPPAAAAWLPARCSRGLAAELLFTGDAITAVDAAAAGLVRKVVPAAALEAEALALAARISRHSGAALRETKRMFRVRHREDDVSAMSVAADLYVNALMQTSDAVEGLRAFLDKRPPVWSHR